MGQNGRRFGSYLLRAHMLMGGARSRWRNHSLCEALTLKFHAGRQRCRTVYLRSLPSPLLRPPPSASSLAATTASALAS
jgi:hypothetical protein